MSTYPPLEITDRSLNHPREHTFAQVAELVAYLLRTPSQEELKRRRAESYARADREVTR